MITPIEIQNTVNALNELKGIIALECTSQDDMVNHPLVVLVNNDEQFTKKIETLMQRLGAEVTEVHGKIIVDEIDGDNSIELTLVVDSSAFYVMSENGWESRPVYYNSICDLNDMASDSSFGESITTNDGRTIHAFDTQEVVRDCLESEGYFDFDEDANSVSL